MESMREGTREREALEITKLFCFAVAACNARKRAIKEGAFEGRDGERWDHRGCTSK